MRRNICNAPISAYKIFNFVANSVIFSEANNVKDLQSLTKYYGNFKTRVNKFPLSPYTMLWTNDIAWRKFCSLFLNIVQSGKGAERQNCTDSSFCHNFCCCLKKSWKLKCGILQFAILNDFEGCNYPLRHYVISLDNFWSRSKQLKCLGRWGKIFIFQTFFR